MSKEFTIKDELINRISRNIDKQTNKGVKKYGHTLDDCPYGAFDWDIMLVEELIDALQYQQKEIRRLRGIVKNMEESK